MLRSAVVSSLGIAAVAVLATPVDVVAQDHPIGVLNKLDVRTLVARGDPEDDQRLFVHFRALADRFETEAETHDAAARHIVGNPSRTSGSGMSEHCKRLADLNRQSAKTLRELAVYHKRVSEGSSAALPRGGARFQGGAGAPDPTERELDALAARARSRTDHLTLAEYFRALATRYTTDANEHVTMASTYRGGRFAQAAVHHDRLASTARESAREARAAAFLHQQLSTIRR